MIRNIKIVLKGFDTKKEACPTDMPPIMNYSDLTIRINQQIDIGLQPLNIAEVLAVRQVLVLREHAVGHLEASGIVDGVDNFERI